ncbi:hypothetical protein CC80DRAFT_492911 [Byssothecium circinans]|uniref:F-box domain-containing protein n=1 Tax=Byssothecium circinans TaxID=147558 RepID=A0A6A5TWJ7_9PLEO|nr:hypothetical protein CC80DRAFT_492911 [Byssothecium circinans]
MKFRRSRGKRSSQPTATSPTTPYEQAPTPLITSPQIFPTSPPPQKAPILSLPLELLQQISTHLSPATAASFSLSTRYIYYAIGTQPLQAHISPPPNSFTPKPEDHNLHYRSPPPPTTLPRIERRKRLEILERAFPSHWYCAWCDTFHARELAGGPTRFRKEAKRDCAEFNSYLHDGWDYVLCFHHVRLAVNRHLWGEGNGIDVSAFTYNSGGVERKIKVAKTHGGAHHTDWVTTQLKTRARVVDGRLILYASYRVSVPGDSGGLPFHLGKCIGSVLPQIVAGHRYSHEPHTGIVRALEMALLPHMEHREVTKTCSVCATDFSIVVSHHSPTASSGSEPTNTIVQFFAWRDLGDGRSPFDTSWRAHGELGNGNEGVYAGSIQMQDGSIRRRFRDGLKA